MSTQLRGQLYFAAYAIGVLLMLIITVIRRRAYKTSIIRAVIYTFVSFLSGFCGAFIIGQVFNVLASFKHITTTVFVDVLGAVVFTSLFLLAAVYLEKSILKRRFLNKETEDDQAIQPRSVSFRDTMDLVIPGAFIVFACIKIGCAVRGCCFGKEWSWGVTAQFYYGKTVFPVQIFESISIFAVAAASHFIQKAHFYRRGFSGPFAAFLYGMARFFWEFFRYTPPELRNYFLGLTIWQLFCILIFVVAGIWIYILFKTQPAEPIVYIMPSISANKSENKPTNKKKHKKNKSKQ